MTPQLIVLLVVLPLLSAPLTALLPTAKWAWRVSLIVCLCCLVLALQLLLEVQSGPDVDYPLGGWQAPWGIAHHIDSLSALVLLIVTAIASVTMWYAPRSVEKEVPMKAIPMFYAAFQLCLLGLLGIVMTADLFNLFVFLEISSLASYALISMGKQRQALTAAFNYLILGTLGATFYLLGVGLLYAASGTLNMADLAANFDQISQQRLVITAFVFIVTGVALKAAIFPLHAWLPPVYTRAPSIISIFLAATATKVAIYVLIRCLYNAFPLGYWAEQILPDILLAAGAVSILYGSYRALTQHDVKRLLAWSSVAQIGYIMLGIGLVSDKGMTASLLHLFNHSVIKAALFMVAGLMLFRANSTDLRELRGFGREAPWTFSMLVIAGLSLVGVPGTAGFISKWHLMMAAIEQQRWGLIVVILCGSMLALLYVWKMIENLYFKPKQKGRISGVTAGTDSIARSPTTMFTATAFLAACCLYFGIVTHLPIDSASSAAAYLLSGGAK